MIELGVIVLVSLVTFALVNWAISVGRRHQEKHSRLIGVNDVLKDATDVSLSVKRFTEQMGK